MSNLETAGWQARAARWLVRPSIALLFAIIGLAFTQRAAHADYCSNPTVVCVGGNLSTDTTWNNTKLYVINSQLTINGGVTLTITHGTIVKVAPPGGHYGTYLDVLGKLVLDTTGAPVIFTSLRDDSVGGDTNGDGNGTVPAPGNWAAIYIERLDPYNAVVSGAAVVRYATYGLDLFNSSLSNQELDGTVAGWTFEKNIYGLMLSPSYGVVSATVTGNAFNQNTYGFGTNYGAGAQSNANLISNSFTNQTGFPIYLGGTAYPTYNGNTFSSNHYRAIGLDGYFAFSGTLAAVNGNLDTSGKAFPYVVFDDGSGLGGVQVGASATMTLPASAVVKFANNCSVVSVGPPIIWRGCWLEVVGALNMQGTAPNPVYSTSFEDDAAGGDSNGDSVATTPAPGDWDGVYLHNSATNFHNAVVRYSSNGVSVYNYSGSPVAPPITSVTFSSNLTSSIALKTFSGGAINSAISNDSIIGGLYGIWMESANGPLAPIISNNAFQSGTWGVYVHSWNSPVSGTVKSNSFHSLTGGGLAVLDEFANYDADIASNTFATSNVGVDFYISATAGIDSQVTGNSFQGNAYGLLTELRVTYDNKGQVNYIGSGASRPNVVNNTFTGHTIYPVALYGSGWPTYSGNTFSSNIHPAIGLGGYHANTGGTWPIVVGDGGQPLPYVVDHDVWLWNDFTNVTFPPGTVLKFKPGTQIWDNGLFTFSGSPGHDTVLASWLDDSVAGDTNHDGSASMPAMDDWRAVQIEHIGWPSTSYIDVRYSTFGIVVDEQTSDNTNNCPTFSHSTFSHNGHGLYFFANLGPDLNACPSVNTSSFTQNFSGVTLETWSDGNLLTVVSSSTFVNNTYGVTTLTRDWPIIETFGPSLPSKPAALAKGAAAMAAPNSPRGASITAPNTTITIPPATGAVLPQLLNNTFQGSYFPLFLGGTGFPSYVGNVFVNSIHDAIRLGGIFNDSRPLNSTFTLAAVTGSHGQTMPYVITQDPTLCMLDGTHCVIPNWKVNYDTYQSHGATVNLRPNAVVKLDHGSYIEAPGELDVQGIEGSPVVFTSYLDDSVGGDTNADGNATHPAPGDWNGVYLESSGVQLNYQLAYAFFKYGTYALSVYDIGSTNIFPVVAHDTFYLNATGLLLYTHSSGNILDPHDPQGHYLGPLIHDNLFFNNTVHVDRILPTAGSGTVQATAQSNCFNPTATSGINNEVATDVITATQNWWGSGSGPSNAGNPGGQGVPVSGHVLFNPWLTSQPAFCQATLHGAQGRVVGLGDSPQTPNPMPGVTMVLNGSVITTTNQSGTFAFRSEERR